MQPRTSCFLFSSLIITVFVTVAFLVACSGATPTLAPTAAVPSDTVAAPAATRTPIQTSTPVPTQTALPTATALPTLTFTPAPSATVTPDAALSEVKLISLAWLENYNMLFTFQFPGPVEMDQYRVMVEEKEYKCQKLAKYPERLYCIGPGAKVLNYAWLRIYPVGSTTPGFEMKRWIPYFDNDYSNQFLPPY